MMTIKYLTKNWSNTNEKNEVERETEKSIWIEGVRESKDNDYQSTFDTFWEAAQYLITEQERKITAAEDGLVYQKTKMQKLKDYIKKQKCNG